MHICFWCMYLPTYFLIVQDTHMQILGRKKVWPLHMNLQYYSPLDKSRLLTQR